MPGRRPLVTEPVPQSVPHFFCDAPEPCQTPLDDTGLQRAGRPAGEKPRGDRDQALGKGESGGEVESRRTPAACAGLNLEPIDSMTAAHEETLANGHRSRLLRVLYKKPFRRLPANPCTLCCH